MRVEELTSFGFPVEGVEILRREGFKELFEPQEVAVNEGVLELRGSYLISVPTASGKTLIAELLMVKAITEARREGRKLKCLYVVPLRALASEKYDSFKRWGELGIKVGMTTGDLDSADPWLAGYDIVVATSEKVDSLIRHGAEWLWDVKVLVADEVHLINDAARGPTLEVIIARLRHLVEGLIILALSATVRNAGEIASWLDAKLIESSWRPVELREGVYCRGSVLYGDLKTRDVDIASAGDAASLLALETVREGGQALVFLSTRRSAESFAERLSLGEQLSEDERAELEALAQRVENALSEPTRTCRRLAACLRKGSAFHHAGLLAEQRKAVEEGFRKGLVKVVSATPTLAAGVNLPARRVIIRDYRRYDVNIGSVEIPVLEYKQMAGRAGRPGYDRYGEALLIARSEAEKDFLLESYVLAEPEDIFSKLFLESALRVHVLSSIASNFANSTFALLEFFSRTLYAHQKGLRGLEETVEKALSFLRNEGMIEEKGKGHLAATPFGRLVARLYIDPLSAVVLRDSLREAESRETNELSYLHAIARTGELSGLYLRRGDAERLLALLAENEERLLLQTPVPAGDLEVLLSELKMASFLQDWINELTEEELRERYGIGAGDIRRRVEAAGWMLYSMHRLGSLLRFSKLSEVKALELRVKHGVRRELLELVSLRGVGRVRARILYSQGYRGIEDLRKADSSSLARIRGIGEALARSILKQVEEAA